MLFCLFLFGRGSRGVTFAREKATCLITEFLLGRKHNCYSYLKSSAIIPKQLLKYSICQDTVYIKFCTCILPSTCMPCEYTATSNLISGDKSDDKLVREQHA